MALSQFWEVLSEIDWPCICSVQNLRRVQKLRVDAEKDPVSADSCSVLVKYCFYLVETCVCVYSYGNVLFLVGTFLFVIFPPPIRPSSPVHVFQEYYPCVFYSWLRSIWPRQKLLCSDKDCTNLMCGCCYVYLWQYLPQRGKNYMEGKRVVQGRREDYWVYMKGGVWGAIGCQNRGVQFDGGV